MTPAVPPKFTLSAAAGSATGEDLPGTGVTDRPAPAGEDRSSLLRAGAHGVLWQGLAQVAGRLATLVTTVVLARILLPEQFGLVALAVVLITYAEAFADAGVAQALVYLPRTRDSLRAALACSLTAGVVLMLAAMVSAPALAAAFHRPDVTPLTRLLAVTLLGASLAALPESLLRRELLFRRMTVATVVRVVLTGVVSIVLAVAGYGAWALAWGTATGSVGYTILIWLFAPERPDLAVWRTTRRDVRQIMAYGMPAAASNLLSRLIFNVDYLIVGGLLGATALGYYTLAFRIPELIIINIFYVISGVAFPMFSRLNRDLPRLRKAYLFSVRVYCLYGLCAGVGLAIVAGLIVPLVFGGRWHDAVAPLVPLALYAACRSIGVGANDVYKALGRPGLALSLSVFRLVVLVPALLAGARYGGIVGVAWAQVGTSLAMAILMQARGARVLSLRLPEVGRAVAPGLLAACAVAAVGLPLLSLPLPAAAILSLVVVAGICTVVAFLALTQRALLRDLLEVVHRRTRGAT